MTIAITEQQRNDLIPLLTKEVIKAFEHETELANMFEIKKLEGTDTLIDTVVGGASVKRVDWSQVDKAAQVGVMGRVTYELDQTVYIRHAEKNISKLISDVDTLKELMEEHGKALAVQRDVTILTCIVRGSMQGAMAASGVSGVETANDLPNTIKQGLHYVMAAANDIRDPDKVVEGLRMLITTMRSNRRASKSHVLVMSFGLYEILRENDKLMSADYSKGNGDYANGELYKFLGYNVVPCTVFQDMQEPVAADNPVSDDWDITELDKQARAVFFSPRSIRVIEAMPVTPDAWYNKDHKVNYIDSQAFYNTGVRRQDTIAALFHYNASQAATVGAGNELTSNVTAASYI